MERNYKGNLLEYLRKRKFGLVRANVQPKANRRLVSVQDLYPSKQAARSDLKGEVLLGFLPDGIHLVSYRTFNQNDITHVCRLTIWETDFRRIFRRVNSFELFELEDLNVDWGMSIVSYPYMDRIVVLGFNIFSSISSNHHLVQCAIIFNPTNSTDEESNCITFQFESFQPYPPVEQPSALRDRDHIIINTGVSIVSLNLKSTASDDQEGTLTPTIKELCEREKEIIRKLDLNISSLLSKESLKINYSSQPPTDTQYLTDFRLKRSINHLVHTCEKPENIPNHYSILHIQSMELEILLNSLLETEIEHFTAVIDYDVQILDTYPRISTVYLLLAVKILRCDPNTPSNGLFNKYFTCTQCYMCKILWRIPTEDVYLIGELVKFNDIEYINEKPFWNPGPKLLLEHSPQKRGYFSTFHNQEELFYLSNRSVLTGKSLPGLRNPCLPIYLTL